MLRTALKKNSKCVKYSFSEKFPERKIFTKFKNPSLPNQILKDSKTQSPPNQYADKKFSKSFIKEDLKSETSFNNDSFQKDVSPKASMIDKTSFMARLDAQNEALKKQVDNDFNGKVQMPKGSQDQVKANTKDIMLGFKETWRNFKFEYKNMVNRMLNENELKKALTSLIESSYEPPFTLTHPLAQFKRDFAISFGTKDVFFQFANPHHMFAEFTPARSYISHDEILENIDKKNVHENLEINKLREEFTFYTEVPLMTIPALPEIEVWEHLYMFKYVFVYESIAFFNFNDEIPEYLFYKILTESLQDIDVPVNEALTHLIEFGRETANKLKSLLEVADLFHTLNDKEILELSKKNDEIMKKEDHSRIRASLDGNFEEVIKQNEVLYSNFINKDELDHLSKKMMLENNPFMFKEMGELETFLEDNPQIEYGFHLQFKEQIKKIQKNGFSSKFVSQESIMKSFIDEMNLKASTINAQIIDNNYVNPFLLQEVTENLTPTFRPDFVNPSVHVVPPTRTFVKSLLPLPLNSEKKNLLLDELGVLTFLNADIDLKLTKIEPREYMDTDEFLKKEIQDDDFLEPLETLFRYNQNLMASKNNKPIDIFPVTKEFGEMSALTDEEKRVLIYGIIPPDSPFSGERRPKFLQNAKPVLRKGKNKFNQPPKKGSENPETVKVLRRDNFTKMKVNDMNNNKSIKKMKVIKKEVTQMGLIKKMLNHYLVKNRGIEKLNMQKKEETKEEEIDDPCKVRNKIDKSKLPVPFCYIGQDITNEYGTDDNVEFDFDKDYLTPAKLQRFYIHSWKNLLDIKTEDWNKTVEETEPSQDIEIPEKINYNDPMLRLFTGKLNDNQKIIFEKLLKNIAQSTKSNLTPEEKRQIRLWTNRNRLIDKGIRRKYLPYYFGETEFKTMSPEEIIAYVNSENIWERSLAYGDGFWEMYKKELQDKANAEVKKQNETRDFLKVKLLLENLDKRSSKSKQDELFNLKKRELKTQGKKKEFSTKEKLEEEEKEKEVMKSYITESLMQLKEMYAEEEKNDELNGETPILDEKDPTLNTIPITEQEMILAIEEQRKFDPTICPDNHEVDRLNIQREITQITDHDFNSIAFRKKRFRLMYAKKVGECLNKHLQKFENLYKAVNIVSDLNQQSSVFDKLFPIFSYQTLGSANTIYKNVLKNSTFRENITLFKNYFSENNFSLNSDSEEKLKYINDFLKINVINPLELKMTFDLFHMSDEVVDSFLNFPYKYIHKQYHEGNYENIVKSLILLACRNKTHGIPEIFQDEVIYKGLSEEYKVLFDIIMLQIIREEDVLLTDLLEKVKFIENSSPFNLLSSLGFDELVILKLQNLIEKNIKKFGSANFDFLPIAFTLNKNFNHRLLVIFFHKENQQAGKIFDDINKLYRSSFQIEKSKVLQALLLEMFFKSKNYQTALANFQLFTLLLNRIRNGNCDFVDLLERLNFLCGQELFSILFEQIMPRFIKISLFPETLESYQRELDLFHKKENVQRKLNAFNEFDLSFFQSDRLQTIYQSDSITPILYDPCFVFYSDKFNHLDCKFEIERGVDLNEIYKNAILTCNKNEALNYLDHFQMVYSNDNFDEIQRAMSLDGEEHRKINCVNKHLEEMIENRVHATNLIFSPRLYGKRLTEPYMKEICGLMSSKIATERFMELGVLNEAATSISPNDISHGDNDYEIDLTNNYDTFKRKEKELKEPENLEEILSKNPNNQQGLRDFVLDQAGVKRPTDGSDSEKEKRIKSVKDFFEMSPEEMRTMLKMNEMRELPTEMKNTGFEYQPFFEYNPNEQVMNIHYRFNGVNVDTKKPKRPRLRIHANWREEFSTVNKRFFSSGREYENENSEEDDAELLENYLNRETDGFATYMKRAAEIDKEFENSTKVPLKEKKKIFDLKQKTKYEAEKKNDEIKRSAAEIREELKVFNTIEKAAEFLTTKVLKVHEINPDKAQSYIESVITLKDLKIENLNNGFQLFIVTFFRATNKEKMKESDELLIELDIKIGKIRRDYNEYLQETGFPFELKQEIYCEIFAYLERNYKRLYFKRAFAHLLLYSKRVDWKVLEKIINIATSRGNGITLFEMGYSLFKKNTLNEVFALIKFSQTKLLKALFKFPEIIEDISLLVLHKYKSLGDDVNEFKFLEAFLEKIHEKLPIKSSILIVEKVCDLKKLINHFSEKRFPDELARTLEPNTLENEIHLFKERLYSFLFQIYKKSLKFLIKRSHFEEAAVIFQQFLDELNPIFTSEEFVMAFRIFCEDPQKIYEFYEKLSKCEKTEVFADKDLFMAVARAVQKCHEEIGEIFIDVLNKFVYSKALELDEKIIHQTVLCFKVIKDINCLGDFLRYLLKKKLCPDVKTREILMECLSEIEDDHSKGYIKGLLTQIYSKERDLNEMVDVSESMEDLEEFDPEEEEERIQRKAAKQREQGKIQDFGMDPLVENRLLFATRELAGIPDSYYQALEKMQVMSKEEEDETLKKLVN